MWQAVYEPLNLMLGLFFELFVLVADQNLIVATVDHASDHQTRDHHETDHECREFCADAQLHGYQVASTMGSMAAVPLSLSNTRSYPFMRA